MYEIMNNNEDKRTKKQYMDFRRRIWRLNNSDKVKIYNNNRNKEKLKEYRIINKEKIKQYHKQIKNQCLACNFKCYNIHDYKRHLKTKKHLFYNQQIEI
jgi:hypothetical protein